MNTPPNHPPEEFVAEADISHRSGISIVWLIPVVALLIGAWLAYKAYTEQGVTITIDFQEANGIVVGKTPLLFRDVEIGKVESVQLSKDLSGVTVTVELQKEAAPLAGENARFWVAQPEISITGVRSLQTLLSGVYIGLDPDTEGAARREFVGLAEQPFITDDQQGRHFFVRAPDRGSLNRGAPVLFRGFTVGKIVSYELVENDAGVDVRIFVDAPHFERITAHTRFWNISGVDVELSADGIKMNTGSIASILVGGIAFANPPAQPAGEPAARDARYTLFANREEAFKPRYSRRRYLLYFNESVRGLSVGAPVEFRGAKMGEVVDLRAQFIADELAFRIPVYVDIEPERFEIFGELAGTDAERASNFQILVERGLRAQLRTGSLLTGQKLIEIDMHPDAEPVTIQYEGSLAIIPTIPTVLDTVTQKISGVLEKLDRLPIEEISEDLRGTMRGVRQLVEKAKIQEAINQLSGALATAEKLAEQLLDETVPALTATLKETEQFTKGLNTELSPQIDEALRELKDAARSIRIMSDYLERNPEALIKGKN